jgi:hypothetical protein
LWDETLRRAARYLRKTVQRQTSGKRDGDICAERTLDWRDIKIK